MTDTSSPLTATTHQYHYSWCPAFVDHLRICTCNLVPASTGAGKDGEVIAALEECGHLKKPEECTQAELVTQLADLARSASLDDETEMGRLSRYLFQLASDKDRIPASAGDEGGESRGETDARRTKDRSATPSGARVVETAGSNEPGPSSLRTGGRVDDAADFETRQSGNAFVGSNPTPSATPSPSDTKPGPSSPLTQPTDKREGAFIPFGEPVRRQPGFTDATYNTRAPTPPALPQGGGETAIRVCPETDAICRGGCLPGEMCVRSTVPSPAAPPAETRTNRPKWTGEGDLRTPVLSQHEVESLLGAKELMEAPTPAGAAEGELLDCPFCGGDPTHFKRADREAADERNDDSLIECDACGICRHDDTDAESIANWNRRATSHSNAGEGWTGRKCPNCAGCGEVDDDSGERMNCPKCGGTGDEYKEPSIFSPPSAAAHPLAGRLLEIATNMNIRGDDAFRVVIDARNELTRQQGEIARLKADWPDEMPRDKRAFVNAILNGQAKNRERAEAAEARAAALQAALQKIKKKANQTPHTDNVIKHLDLIFDMANEALAAYDDARQAKESENG